MGKGWQRKRKNEHFYKKAKKEEFRSRAAYKLLQLNDRFKILKEGDVVVDLGSAPGSWLQVVAERVGEEGFVLGVDLEPIEEFEYDNVTTIQADITKSNTEEMILTRLPKNPDVVISDASPDISGIWDVDHARSIDLAQNVLNIAKNTLDDNGNVLIKVFQGEHFDKFLESLKDDFKFYKSSKPKASRKKSSEIYVIGRKFKKHTVG